MIGKATTDTVKQLTYLAAALKVPRIVETAARLADQARDSNWSHEDYLAAVLEREVSGATSYLLLKKSGGSGRMVWAEGRVLSKMVRWDEAQGDLQLGRWAIYSARCEVERYVYLERFVVTALVTDSP